MTCDESQNLLNAKLDGEVMPEDRTRLETHLSECATCTAAGDVLAAQHAKLRQAFLPRRRATINVAHAVIAQLPHKSFRRIPWLAMLVAAAAGFALAFGLFHVNERKTVVVRPTSIPTSRPSPIARLALSTGVVQFKCPGQTEWSTMATGGEVLRGTLVRTGPDIRCEFRTTDGSDIRLNAQTQVELKTPRTFELTQGQVWSTVAHDNAPFEAMAMGTVFTAMGTQFDLATETKAVVLTVVEGSVRVKGQNSQETLQSGERLAVTEGHLGGKTEVRDLALATRWVNEILVMKGRDNPELTRRIDDLFAQIGQQKMGFMFEEEIRALGDHSVIPLTRYIESDRSKHEPAQRAVAARIISDVAPPWAIPNLISLVQNSDGEVRYYAALGLRRLTGRDAGRTPEQLRSDDPFSCQQSANHWQKWWLQNRSHYPGVPAFDSPEPQELPVVKQRMPMKKS